MNIAQIIETGDKEAIERERHSSEQCVFGAWLERVADIQPLTASGTYELVRHLHQEWHQTVSAILKNAEAGAIDQAQLLANGELGIRSRNLVLALVKWRDEAQSDSLEVDVDEQFAAYPDRERIYVGG